ncbi:MAG: toxin-antitoxin system YwqK family antitoxin [Spirochaetes bacterium]|nr:toxin-antitoxin system YwqK family antitoxin [Spirochaetota bacterium]
MHRPLIPIFAALLLASCGLVGGNWTLPWKSAPAAEKTALDGTVRLFDEQRRLDRVLRYEKGVLSGPAFGYFPSGALKWQVHYLDGKKHGIQRMYFENGKLRSEAPYIEGKMSGVVTEYDASGRLLMEIPVKDGRISGQVVRYHYDEPAHAPPETRGLPPRTRVREATEALGDQEWADAGERRPAPRSLGRGALRGQEDPDSLVDADAMLGEQDVPDSLPAGGPFALEQDGDSPARAVFSSRWTSDEVVDASASAYAPRERRDERPVRLRDENRSRRTAARETDTDFDQDVAVERDARRSVRIGRRPCEDDRLDPVAENPTCARGSGCPYHGASRASQTTFWDLKTPTPAQMKEEAPRASLRYTYEGQALPREVTRRASEASDETAPSGRRRAPAFTDDESPRDNFRDDPDALARENLLRQWDRKGRSSSGNTVLVRQTDGGTEYLVYPEGGLREGEAWRVRMLRRGLDPNDAIRRGI